MASDKQGFRWGIERKLEFIESQLFWEGGVNRSDIVDEFGVSVPQASKDLALYQKQAPRNIEYDKSLKRYFASQIFRPKFIELDAEAYLEHLTASRAYDRSTGTECTIAMRVDKLPIPQRRIRPDVLRPILDCVRDCKSIEIFYQSMSSTKPDPFWRRISPHAFASDGLRWHVRAFCHIDGKFKDFILSRCLDARSSVSGGTSPSEDTLWGTIFPVSLRPNPRLTVGQQLVIAEDFGMENGEAVVPVRKALLYYFSKRLRLDVAEQFDDLREAPVVVKNKNEFDIALAEAMQ